jgi:hypothetical protein
MTEPVILTCDALSVAFQKRGDRYAHQISCDFPDGPSGLLVSREGTPADVWPPSPVLQSLHIETQADGIQTALLVGSAGRSHWSMSVSADASRHRLHFDVACRIHDAPQWLGSTYDAPIENASAWPADSFTQLAYSNEKSAEEVAVQFKNMTGLIKFPAPQVVGNGPQTIRWQYTIHARKSQ